VSKKVLRFPSNLGIFKEKKGEKKKKPTVSAKDHPMICTAEGYHQGQTKDPTAHWIKKKKKKKNSRGPASSSKTAPKLK